MKTKTLKTNEVGSALSVALGELPFEVHTSDDNISGVRVGSLFFSASPYNSGLKVSRVVDYDEVDRWRVRVDHPNFASLNRYFETSSESSQFASSYEAISDTTVHHDLLKVHVDEQGKVIAELGSDGTARPLAPQDNGGDDLPF